MVSSNNPHSHDIPLEAHRSSQKFSGIEHTAFDSVRESLHGFPDYVQTFLFNCFAHRIPFHVHSKNHIILSEKHIDLLELQMKRNILFAIDDIREHYGIKISVVESLPEQNIELIKEIKHMFQGIM